VVEFVVAVLPVFVASVVECVEAWTIVVAVGLTRGWRAPLVGVAAAVAVIGVLVAIFGVTLVDRIDEQLFQVLIGTLLVLFGVRWMRKAILRYIGAIPLHDEELAFRRELELLGDLAPVKLGFDWIGFSLAGKAMLLEGLEITFLVITLGTSGDASYPVAITGAAAAFVAVGGTGLILRRPLSKIPENTLKAFVSVMLVTFGTYWVTEGMGVDWAGGAWALLYLFAVWALFLASTVSGLRRDVDELPVGAVASALTSPGTP
jgi:uncharacterized membrane protein